MFEKRWAAVPPQSFTNNGTAQGAITVLDSSLFKVKQQVNISSNTLPNLSLEIKSIPDKTTIWVGLPTTSIFTYSDVSAYLVADGATISAIEQKRSSVPQEEIFRAVYEEEPTVATRTIGVDKLGNPYSVSNPMPVSSVSVWDEIDLTYDANQNLETVTYIKDATVKVLTLEYDANMNLTKVTRS